MFLTVWLLNGLGEARPRCYTLFLHVPPLNSIFDIIGPAMVGPSSSHTAGAVRIGLLAHGLLGATPTRARISLHGSFAATGRGHATDRGLVAGLLGWAPDDERLKEALTLAAERGVAVTFDTVDLGEAAHPNSVRLELAAPVVDPLGIERHPGQPEQFLTVTASSVGGGNVEISEINGFATCLTGSLDALVMWHDDRPGFLAHVTAVFACVEANIATIRTARRHRGADALTVIELDTPPEPEVVAMLGKISHVHRERVLPRLQ